MFLFIFVLCFISLNKKSGKYYNKSKTVTISSSFVLFYIVSAISWYIYISKSSTFKDILILGNNIASSVTEFLNPQYSFTVRIFINEFPLSIEILKYLYLISAIFIASGILDLLLSAFFQKENRFKFNYEYTVLSIILFAFLLGTFVPRTSTAITTDRVYMIASILLAPFCIIGGIAFIENVEKIYNRNHKYLKNNKNHYKIMSLFLMVFLLFNSGWMSEVIIKDGFYPCIYLSKERIMNNKNIDIQTKTYLYSRYTFDCDVVSSLWLLKNMEIEKVIYTDVSRNGNFFVNTSSYTSIPYISTIKTGIIPHIRTVSIDQIDQESYIYLRYLNIKEGIIITSIYPTFSWNYTSEFFSILDAGNKIYTNEGSEIYYH